MSASTVTLRSCTPRDRELVLELAKAPVPERMVGRVNTHVLIDPQFDAVHQGLPGTYVVDTVMEGSLAVAAVLPPESSTPPGEAEDNIRTTGTAQLFVVGHRQWCSSGTWKAIVRACADQLASLSFTVVVAETHDRSTRKTLTQCGFNRVDGSEQYLTWMGEHRSADMLSGGVVDGSSQTPSAGRLRVVTGMPLSERARVALADELGEECDIVDIRQAGGQAEVVLVPPLSGMALGSLRAMFPGARIIYAEVLDLDGRGFSGPVTRALSSGADGYLVAPDLEGLAESYRELEQQLVVGNRTPLILPDASTASTPTRGKSIGGR